MEFITSVMKRSIIYIGNKVSNSKINPTTHSSLVDNLRSEGFQVFSASAQKIKFFRILEMMWVFLRKYQQAEYLLIDVYSTQNFWYAVIIGKLADLFSIKYIPILHGGDLISRFKRSKEVTRNLLKNAFYIVSPSEYLKLEVEKMGLDRVINIPNSLEPNNYQFQLRREIQSKLLWVRAFDEIYNPMLAINAFELILEKYPSAQLCMVGPDKDGSLEECKNYVRSKNFNVTFPGKLKKKEWIKLSTDFDIFLNTSRIDNIPVSVLEAISLGLPIISTNVGGIPYLIEDGVNGILVESNNAKAMSEAIKFLLEHPDKAQQFAVNANEQLEKYDWEIIKLEWFKLLN